jgi:hypothetical protein
LIPAPPNLAAVYRIKGDDAKVHPQRKTLVGNRMIDLAAGEYLHRDPIVAFNDDGDPLILDEDKLVPASTAPNFVGVGESETARIVQIVPADGWIVWRFDDGPWSVPLVAWGLTETGRVVPLQSDDNGLVLEFEERTPSATLRHAREGEPKEWIAERQAELEKRRPEKDKGQLS